jgi:TolA-binding protein
MSAIAGEVLAALGIMAKTTKTAIEIVKAVKEHVKNADAAKQLETALTEIKSINSQILPLEEKVRSLNTQIVHLENENAALLRQETKSREETSQKEERAAERQKYKPHKIGPSLFMVHEDYPGILFCFDCFETKKTPVTVQPGYTLRRANRRICSYHCNSCKKTFQI